VDAAFVVCMGPSKAPEISLFKQYGQWALIDQDDYHNASSGDYVLS